jgi:hypothetical protein
VTNPERAYKASPSVHRTPVCEFRKDGEHPQQKKKRPGFAARASFLLEEAA